MRIHARKLVRIIVFSALIGLPVLACTSTTVAKNTSPYIYTNNESSKFEILGEILFESKERIGFVEILKAARNLYPDCDYVIDIMIDRIDTTTTNTTNFFVRSSTAVNTEITWVMRGTAIRYVR